MAENKRDWKPSDIKQIIHCDIEATVNSLIKDGEWVVLRTEQVKTRKSDDGGTEGSTMFVLGRIR